MELQSNYVKGGVLGNLVALWNGVLALCCEFVWNCSETTGWSLGALHCRVTMKGSGLETYCNYLTNLFEIAVTLQGRNF